MTDEEYKLRCRQLAYDNIVCTYDKGAGRIEVEIGASGEHWDPRLEYRTELQKHMDAIQHTMDAAIVATMASTQTVSPQQPYQPPPPVAAPPLPAPQLSVGQEYRAVLTGFCWKILYIIGNRVVSIVTVGNTDWKKGTQHVWAAESIRYSIADHTLVLVTSGAVTPGPRKILTCAGRCGLPNDYAEPNQPDGTFVCYGCRG